MSFMINFDGAIFKEQSTLGAGVFIRDDNRYLIAALSCKGRAIMDQEEAKLVAVGQATRLLILQLGQVQEISSQREIQQMLLTNYDPRRKIIHARSCGGGSNTKNESVQAMEGKLFQVRGESTCICIGMARLLIG